MCLPIICATSSRPIITCKQIGALADNRMGCLATSKTRNRMLRGKMVARKQAEQANQREVKTFSRVRKSSRLFGCDSWILESTNSAEKNSNEYPSFWDANAFLQKILFCIPISFFRAHKPRLFAQSLLDLICFLVMND